LLKDWHSHLTCRQCSPQESDFLFFELEVGNKPYALFKATKDGELTSKGVFPEVQIKAENSVVRSKYQEVKEYNIQTEDRQLLAKCTRLCSTNWL
jgi:hypothetical protein